MDPECRWQHYFGPGSDAPVKVRRGGGELLFVFSLTIIYLLVGIMNEWTGMAGGEGKRKYGSIFCFCAFEEE